MQQTSVTLSTTYLILDKIMNPAVGLTKILNYLEESQEILNEIKKNNDVVFSLNEELQQIADFRKQLVDILKNESMEDLEKLLTLTSITDEGNLQFLSKTLKSNLEPLLEAKKHFLNTLAGVHYNSSERIKILKGQERLNWFTSWEKHENKFEMLGGIVTAYSNWEYPVMEIFPGTGKLLTQALSAEPLYIVDWDPAILTVCSDHFNEYYATKRLMKYQIDGYNLDTLPQNSFGFIYSVNQTLIENLENITELSKNTFKCLLPGGIFLIAYNSSNYWWSINNIIDHGYGIVDKEELEQSLTDIGYEIIDHKHDKEINISYVIVKKPGEIEYIKNSSILANIIDKPKDLM